MGKLTESQVLAKSRASSLDKVKNLNCWGNEINDISIIRQMPNLEVLSLSVNEVSTLEDACYCPKIKELYLRKNCISDIGDVIYLKNLSRLHVVWLSDNPCTEGKTYRMTMIRNLPSLKKLDNVEITDEERRQAYLIGEELSNPDDLPDYTGIDLSVSLLPGDLEKFRTQATSSPSIDEKPVVMDTSLTVSKSVDVDEVNERRIQLGLKPLNLETSCETAASTLIHAPDRTMARPSSVLPAILLLLNDLDVAGLRTIVSEAESKLKSFERTQMNEANELITDYDKM